MKKLACSLIGAAVVVLACEQPPAQGPTEWSYQNGYAQAARPNGQTQNGQPVVTYTPVAGSSAAAGAATLTEEGVATTQPAPTATTQGATEIQTTPVPLGVQALPPPVPSTAVPLGAGHGASTTTSDPATTSSMAVPGKGAFVCASDAQCLLGRCNAPYGKCAYPCKHTELDCKSGNVCTASGLCMPRGAAGVGM